MGWVSFILIEAFFKKCINVFGEDTTATELSVVESIFKLDGIQGSAVSQGLRSSLIDTFT